MSLAWFATRPQAEAPASIVDKLATEPAPAADMAPDSVPSLPETAAPEQPAPAGE